MPPLYFGTTLKYLHEDDGEPANKTKSEANENCTCKSVRIKLGFLQIPQRKCGNIGLPSKETVVSGGCPSGK